MQIQVDRKRCEVSQVRLYGFARKSSTSLPWSSSVRLFASVLLIRRRVRQEETQVGSLGQDLGLLSFLCYGIYRSSKSLGLRLARRARNYLGHERTAGRVCKRWYRQDLRVL